MGVLESEQALESKKLEEILEQEETGVMKNDRKKAGSVEGEGGGGGSDGTLKPEILSAEEIEKVNNLHKQELKLMKAAMEAKHKRDREMLEAELEVLREKTKLKLRGEGANEGEIMAAMKVAESDEKQALAGLAGEQQIELAKKVTETEELHKSVIEEEGDEINYEDQLSKMKDEHDRDLLMLEHELETNKQKRKQALQDKLKARKAARELRKQQQSGGGEGEEEDDGKGT